MTMNSLTVYSDADHVAATRNAFMVMSAALGRRGITVKQQETDAADADVMLSVDGAIAPESYQISTGKHGNVLIAGGDSLGLLYGVGKFLQTCKYNSDGFAQSTWRGGSEPDCRVRGIYFANNFQNWNFSAPVAELKEYFGELALWGLNTVAFNFPHYANGTPESQARRLSRNRELIGIAADLGLKTALLYAPNTGYSSPPADALAEPFPDADPPRRGFSNHFVCPSNPVGWEFLVRELSGDLDCYADLPIDYIVSFPYDAGGCGCSKCRPWGANGFVRLSRQLSKLAKARHPGLKFILTTWCYDVLDKSEGEYDGLCESLDENNDWCDLIMADAHGDFPRYPIENKVPGGLPMINFAEISMWGRYPWGGSGANPLTRRIENIWRQASHILDGGLPYSEGRFEDINKVCCLQLDWQRNANVADIVREYANFEFGSAVVNQVSSAVAQLERSYPMEDLTLTDAEQTLALLEEAAALMPPWAATSWRWRILYLRALIDAETMRSPEVVTVRRNHAYEELSVLYCAQNAGNPVAPRSASFYARDDIDQKGPLFAEHIGEHASDPSAIK